MAVTLAMSLSACASTRLDRLSDDLKSALAGEPVEVTRPEGAVKLTSSADYLYAPGAWQLNPGAPILSKMVPTFSKLQETKIVVAGYTDNTPVGPQLQRVGIANNTDLSLKRAGAAVSYFKSQGVKPDLLVAQGFGESNPVAPNDTPEGRAKNRRIEITLTGDGR
jgi:chemotaxis protein MotB